MRYKAPAICRRNSGGAARCLSRSRNSTGPRQGVLLLLGPSIAADRSSLVQNTLSHRDAGSSSRYCVCQHYDCPFRNSYSFLGLPQPQSVPLKAPQNNATLRAKTRSRRQLGAFGPSESEPILKRRCWARKKRKQWCATRIYFSAADAPSLVAATITTSARKGAPGRGHFPNRTSRYRPVPGRPGVSRGFGVASASRSPSAY